jgi:REP element-mobilizing transposase RayT
MSNTTSGRCYRLGMAGRGRVWSPTGVYHVALRGNGGERIFRGHGDYERYLDLFDRTAMRFGWRLYAWCLMGNHGHKVLEAEPRGLAAGMQWLKSTYAVAFNVTHGRRGHLFQRPYTSRPILTTEHLYEAIGYVHRNPSRAGLVGRPVDWEWSSARSFAGFEPPRRPHLGCEPGRALFDDPRDAVGIAATMHAGP